MRKQKNNKKDSLDFLDDLLTKASVDQDKTDYRMQLAAKNDTKKLDTSKICNVFVENVTRKEYPLFENAYISSAEWKGGKPLTEDELDILNEDFQFVFQQAEKQYY